MQGFWLIWRIMSTLAREATRQGAHSVRAVVCLAKLGAHGVTRPTCSNVIETAIGRFWLYPQMKSKNDSGRSKDRPESFSPENLNQIIARQKSQTRPGLVEKCFFFGQQLRLVSQVQIGDRLRLVSVGLENQAAITGN